MQVQRHHTQKLLEKIRRLPPDKVAVVDDFVDFLQHREEMEHLVKEACKISEKSFQNVWAKDGVRSQLLTGDNRVC